MSEHTTHPSADDAAEHEHRMLKAIVRDVVIAVPVALAALFVAMMVFTDKPVIDSLATATLPGILIGVFFGGFSGTARTMG